MTAPDPEVRVRIIGTTSAQLVSAAITLAAVAALVIYSRRRTVVPLFATRTARKLRTLAQRIEDAGLNVARPDA